MLSEGIQQSEQFLYNHLCAPLSALDLEVVRAVPPGGDWRDLSQSIVRKSARLRQISNSGGRTTYYGRLSGDLPSYTINTYFNRPGNGTFIHPTQNRLISMREAARLQSFPDIYRFLGSLSSRFKQIGNAVPPLLAKAIGEEIKQGKCIDLFCGAGGLSLGLTQAGHRIVVASDFNSNMCETYHFNHEDTRIVSANLFDSSESEYLMSSIESELGGRTLNLLAGGPPCQGFSTAGKWSSSDSRNDLIFRTMDFIFHLRPEYILLENVPGFRWINQGKSIQSLLDSLSIEGYRTQVFLLKAEEYGVPQRRRRVFIVGTRNGDLIKKPEVQFSSISQGSRTRPDAVVDDGHPFPITVFEAIGDLPQIESGGGMDLLEYDSTRINSEYQKYMRGYISYDTLRAKRAEQG